MSGPTYRERIGERLRLLQIYEIFLHYGSDALFDRGMLGDSRRALQGWFYGLRLAPLSEPEKVRLMIQELGPTYVKLGQVVSSRADTLPAEWETELARLQSDANDRDAIIAAGGASRSSSTPQTSSHGSTSSAPLPAA